MMKTKKSSVPVAVTSRSFSQHEVLRAELLENYENVKFNDEGKTLSGKALVEFLRGYPKAITALETIDRSIIEQLPGLKVISKYGVGIDMLDIRAMEDHGVSLGWQGGVNRRSVAELAIAFMITLIHRASESNQMVLAGTWKQIRGRQISGRTIGIIGCGHIGKEIAMLLQPFGCTLLSYDIRTFPGFYEKYNVKAVSLEDLLKSADIVTLHVPLNDTTKNMLDSSHLALMKKGAILINTARGGLVDENKVKQMLVGGELSGAAFDVFAQEPPQDTELLNHQCFIATGHIGGSTEDAVLAMGRSAIKGLDTAGTPSKVIEGSLK